MRSNRSSAVLVESYLVCRIMDKKLTDKKKAREK